ncbi:hypothetical protein GCM10010221_28420 [Streptomyces parvus]|nr:hypothetical protein GCM10010221_28420 [Streptomyces parvus]
MLCNAVGNKGAGSFTVGIARARDFLRLLRRGHSRVCRRKYLTRAYKKPGTSGRSTPGKELWTRCPQLMPSNGPRSDSGVGVVA